MNTPNTDDIAIPAMLMALLCAVILYSGLNPTLSLTLNHAFQRLPDSAWAHLTILGDALVCLALINLGAKRYPLLLPAAFLGGLLATLLTRSFKTLLAVDRPLANLGEQIHVIGIDLHHLSFPSGHTTAIFLTAGLYALASQRGHIVALLFSAALLIGFSRIAVGAHWVADVCAGAALGWLCAGVGWVLATRWRWAHDTWGKRVFGLLFLLFALLLWVSDTGYPQARHLQTAIAAVTTLVAVSNLWQTWQKPTSVTPA